MTTPHKPTGAPLLTATGSPQTADPAKPLIREWHAMNADEQAAEWAALVEWVIWIHDLYELSREERLPLCWTRHPGLIEELRSLKAWRTAIYAAPDAAAAAHTARSWHGELRQTIAAASTFWAPGCRAGHTDATLFADVHPDLAEKWQQARPPVMASSPTLDIAVPALTIDELRDGVMRAALDTGRAQIHSRGTPYYAQLDGAWWTRSNDGTTWLRCIDPAHHAQLDATSTRMRAADTARDHVDRPE